jgi:UDP-N-acetylglucosamine--N-acetylmuramyl-(pentapeptide) pyrophosphoryl-undecaprenol N-acetylglucosamine transferase
VQLIRLLAASITVRRLIRTHQIEAVFTTGGYIAAPAILGARWCGVPAVLHESNAIPGRVTRLLGRFCSAVAVGLPVAAERIPGCRPVLTGTPVRSLFSPRNPCRTGCPPALGRCWW